MRFLLGVCTASMVLGSSMAAMADDYEYDDPYGETYTERTQGFIETLDIAIGGGAMSTPEYEGGGDNEFRILPYFDIRYKDFAQLNIDGLNFTFLRGENFKGGAGFGFDFGREDDDASRLRGLGDVDPTIEGRLFAGYEVGAVDMNIAFAQDLIDGHEGHTIESDVGYRIIFKDSGTFVRPSVGVNYASGDYMQSYFGVNGAQAASSGLNAYDADAGFKDVNAGVFVSQRLDENWALVGLARYSVLQDEASDSPVVEEDYQFSMGGFVTYKF